MNEQVVLKSEHLVKIYGKRRVVNDVSIEIEQGETVGLLGPNGAGKTTLIKLMVGILKIQAGQIEILQAPIGSYSQKKLTTALKEASLLF